MTSLLQNPQLKLKFSEQDAQVGSKLSGNGSQATTNDNPDSKVQAANMGPTWGRQDPGGTHVGPMNLAI